MVGTPQEPLYDRLIAALHVVVLKAALAAEWEDLTGFLESKGYPKARLDAQMKPPAINQIYALIDDELWHYDGRLTDKNPKALCTLAEANMKNRMGIHQLIRKELN